jgi:hypothetical protein
MNIDLEIGDTILTGRFKNKPVVVKAFGTDEKGQPTINGRPALKFRIKKLMANQNEQIRNIVKEEILNYLRNKSKASITEIKKSAKSIAVLIKESGILYKAGVKKYGKEGMTKIQSAAGKGENHEEIGKIKDKYEKGKNETVDEKKKLLNDKLSKSQMAFIQTQLKPNSGDIITYDRFFKFGKVARDEKAKVVAVKGYSVQLDNGNVLDLRSFPIKKVNNKVYDRDLSMYDDMLMR